MNECLCFDPPVSIYNTSLGVTLCLIIVSFLLQINLKDFGLITFYFSSFTNFTLELGSSAKFSYCLLIIEQNQEVSNLSGEEVQNFILLMDTV